MQLRIIASLVGLSAAAFIVAAGCDSDAEERAEERAEMREELNEAQPVERERPAQGLTQATFSRITQARCAREKRCGNIGPDEDYASDQACSAKVSAEWKDELNRYECPGGIDGEALGECLEEIKNEDCNAPFDTLGRVVACRSSDICKVLG